MLSFFYRFCAHVKNPRVSAIKPLTPLWAMKIGNGYRYHQPRISIGREKKHFLSLYMNISFFLSLSIDKYCLFCSFVFVVYSFIYFSYTKNTPFLILLAYVELPMKIIVGFVREVDRRETAECGDS